MAFCRTLLALVVCASVLRAGELRTLKGEAISGEVVSVDSKEVVINKAGQRVTVATADVLLVDMGTPPGKVPVGAVYLEVELVDGSLLRCSALGIKGKEAELTLLLTGQKVKLPLAGIANLLTEAHIEKNRKDWQERLHEYARKKTSRDVLALVREGVVNGLEGTLGSGDEEGKAIAFTLTSGKSAQVALERIHGLIFWRPANTFLAPVLFKLIDSHQDLVMVSAATTSETGLTVTTPAGAKIDYPFNQIVKLDYSKGKLTYLSDLTPSRLMKDDKDKEGIVFFEKDRTPNDDRFSLIKMNNITYPKGLFIQATTEVEYDLNGDYREFKAMVGLDDYDKRSEDCPTTLVIEGDSKELLSLTINPKDKTRVYPVTLNIKDMQKLRIIVRSGGGVSTVARQITLGDAKVSK